MNNPAPKNRTGLIIGLVVAAVALCCVLPIGLLGGGTWWMMKNGSGFLGCTMTYQGLADVLQEYAAAHEGKLPPAKTWEAELKPYFAKYAAQFKSTPFSLMDPEGQWGCKAPAGKDGKEVVTGMTYNLAVAGKKLSEIPNASATPILFETQKTGRNLTAEYKPEPYEKGPTMMGNMKDHRGWFMINADLVPYMTSKTGKLVPLQKQSGFGASVSTD